MRFGMGLGITRRRTRIDFGGDPPPPPEGAVTVVSDSFNRANSATTLGSPETGPAAWVAQRGTWGISGNHAYIAASLNPSIATVDSGVSDATVGLKVGSLSGQPMLVARFVDTSNFLMLLSTGTSWTVRKKKAGSTSTLYSTTFAVAVGDLAELVMVGDQVEVRINGLSEALLTEPDFQTATKHGMGANLTNVSGYAVDDFSVVTP